MRAILNSRKIRLAAPSVALAALVAVLVVPAMATAESTSTSTVPTIAIKVVGKKMDFYGPKTVRQGEELRVVDETNPMQVGPHTFSLVTKGSLPKTKKAQKTCFTPGKICKAVAGWYALKGEENPKVPLLEVGSEGWDTMGTISKKGDSMFFSKKGQSVEQVVSAEAGTTLYFMCAVHSFMQGSIKVLPPAA